MGDDERARVTTPPRLAVIITATLLGGMIAAVAVVGSTALESPLTSAARVALGDAGVEGVSVRFEGREAHLRAEGASDAQLAAAAESERDSEQPDVRTDPERARSARHAVRAEVRFLIWSSRSGRAS